MAKIPFSSISFLKQPSRCSWQNFNSHNLCTQVSVANLFSTNSKKRVILSQCDGMLHANGCGSGYHIGCQNVSWGWGQKRYQKCMMISAPRAYGAYTILSAAVGRQFSPSGRIPGDGFEFLQQLAQATLSGEGERDTSDGTSTIRITDTNYGLRRRHDD